MSNISSAILRWTAIFTLAYLLVEASDVPVAAQEPPQESAAQPALEKIPVPALFDSTSVKELIEAALHDLENAKDPNAKTAALSTLFGNPFFGAFEPPADIQRMLIKRKLNYAEWQCRLVAAWQFQYMLQHDPDLLIPILRDGLNDPHPEVRGQSTASLAHLLNVTLSPTIFGTGNPSTKAKIEKHREKYDDYIDEIVDLLASKSLLDNATFANVEALKALEYDDLPPTRTRLRSIERALRTGRVQKDLKPPVQELARLWRKAINMEE